MFDNDAAGQKATEKALRVLPDAMVAALPADDPNACLMEGLSEALCNAVLNGKG